MISSWYMIGKYIVNTIYIKNLQIPVKMVGSCDVKNAKQKNEIK